LTTTKIRATDQDLIDTLQVVLLIGRLPPELARNLLGRTGEPRDLSCAVCLMFAGMGIYGPLPTLASNMDGTWYTYEESAQ
jgi:hypothetical protein